MMNLKEKHNKFEELWNDDRWTGNEFSVVDFGWLMDTTIAFDKFIEEETDDMPAEFMKQINRAWKMIHKVIKEKK